MFGKINDEFAPYENMTETIFLRLRHESLLLELSETVFAMKTFCEYLVKHSESLTKAKCGVHRQPSR